jgi:hypothetical protein
VTFLFGGICIDLLSANLTTAADQPIQTLNRILLIECADGEEMPYQDYITVELGAIVHSREK